MEGARLHSLALVRGVGKTKEVASATGLCLRHLVANHSYLVAMVPSAEVPPPNANPPVPSAEGHTKSNATVAEV